MTCVEARDTKGRRIGRSCSVQHRECSCFQATWRSTATACMEALTQSDNSRFVFDCCGPTGRWLDLEIDGKAMSVKVPLGVYGSRQAFFSALQDAGRDQHPKQLRLFGVKFSSHQPFVRHFHSSMTVGFEIATPQAEVVLEAPYLTRPCRSWRFCRSQMRNLSSNKRNFQN